MTPDLDALEAAARAQEQRPIDQIRDAAGRLHATAWRGAKGWDSPERARFSIPRQGSDDDEIVYAAIEELGQLRAEVRRLREAVVAMARCPHPDDAQKWFRLRREYAVRWCAECGAIDRYGDGRPREVPAIRAALEPR